ncbi:MAG: hypothetical protein LC772_06565 [Chloroflexi bacterium]|nr:hypothetical protein [Chloroflexota bacterium]
MTMTDAQYQQLIAIETGTATYDILGNPTATGNTGAAIALVALPLWWQSVQTNGKTGRLAYLHCKLSVLRFYAGVAKRRKDIVIGPDQIRASQVFKNCMEEVKDWAAYVQQQDPEDAVAVMQTIAPTSTVLDTVEETMEFIRQYNPSLIADTGWDLGELGSYPYAP